MSNRARATAHRQPDSGLAVDAPMTPTPNHTTSRSPTSTTHQKQPSQQFQSPFPLSATNTPDAAHRNHIFHHHQQQLPQQQQQHAVPLGSMTNGAATPGPGGGGSGGVAGTTGPSPNDTVAAPSGILQPRVAVVLGVPKAWYPFLFLCRLASVVPAVWYGLPSGLRLLAMLYIQYFSIPSADGTGIVLFGRLNTTTTHVATSSPFPSPSSCPATTPDPLYDSRLRLTETLLANIWCGSSAYLSFVFTDCLMSRWLLNYTPVATLVRLVCIDIINMYITTFFLWITGGSQDPRLLLPAWVSISSTLTILYHITQRHVNIRKETRLSINIFSFASFISMLALLAQVHSNRSDYPSIPAVNIIKWLFREGTNLALRIMEYGNATRDL